MTPPLLPQEKLTLSIEKQVLAAIEEDVGKGDLTALLIPENQHISAHLITRESAILCGTAWANAVFATLAPNTEIRWHFAEGDAIPADAHIATFEGNARQILTAERSTLNFLQTLSGTATITRRYVDAISGTSARILDTRKTLPGWRIAQKYAVTVGGGLNQRMGLDDGILIKENHIAAAGSIEAAVQTAKALHAGVSIQIEVETLKQLETALTAGAENILLDNFAVETLSKAVAINQKRAVLEASGGITLENVREVALTGVHRISIGSLTKHIHAVDLSLRVV